MIFFDVKMDGNSENISQIVPSTKENGQNIVELNGQKSIKVNSAGHKENMELLLELLKSLKQLEGSEDERFVKEWQTIAKILDRLLFILNIISFVIAFGYGYTTLYTYWRKKLTGG